MLTGRILLGALASILLLVNGAADATAVSPVDCGADGQWDGSTCRIKVSTPGHAASDTSLSTSTGDATRACSYGTTPMPCQDPELGYWSDSRSCYVKLTAVQPPVSATVWDGHTEGAIYDCSLPKRGVFGGLVMMFWSPTTPAGPDPRALAQTAIASMNLRPISIGIVPEDRPGSVGLVGMPVWLWAANPSQQTWGPITRTASAGGVTVRATAHVSRVRWQMGDGNVVVCAGPGTVYEDRFGRSDSPTCGYAYRKQGTFTVRAESQWSVAWSGMGVSGTIPVTLTRATTITVGELQVITTG